MELNGRCFGLGFIDHIANQQESEARTFPRPQTSGACPKHRQSNHRKRTDKVERLEYLLPHQTDFGAVGTIEAHVIHRAYDARGVAEENVDRYETFPIALPFLIGFTVVAPLKKRHDKDWEKKRQVGAHHQYSFTNVAGGAYG